MLVECRYCEEFALPSQPTCGSQECLDRHVQVQLSRAEVAAARGMDGDFGFQPGVTAIIFRLERLLSQETECTGFEARQALAGALWRSLNRQPSLALAAEVTLDSVTLKEGGRRIELGLLSLPSPNEHRRRG